MGIQEICEDVVKETDGVLGCFILQPSSGLMLAAANGFGAQGLDDAEFNQMLRASRDLFCGKLMEQFVSSLPTPRVSAAGYVREVQIKAGFAQQFMAALGCWDDCIVVLMTEKSISVGLGWMTTHQTVDRLEEAGIETPDAARVGGASAIPLNSPSESPDAMLTSRTRNLDPEPVPPEQTPASGVWGPQSVGRPPLPDQPLTGRTPESPASRGTFTAPVEDLGDPTAIQSDHNPASDVSVPVPAKRSSDESFGRNGAPHSNPAETKADRSLEGKPSTERTGKTSSEARKSNPTQPKQDVTSGPRAKLFRARRSSKNK